MEVQVPSVALSLVPVADPDDPHFKSVELAQRARMTVDIATADLEVAEARLGTFHDTTWHFRRALAEAEQAWQRLRALYGLRALDAALAEPPALVMRLGRIDLIPIQGRTYRAEPLPGTDLAPRQFRLTPLHPADPDPVHTHYHACRLADGSTQCDCAEWTYRLAEPVSEPAPRPCKHLAALIHLGWL
jgi:hypothetical protein